MLNRVEVPRLLLQGRLVDREGSVAGLRGDTGRSRVRPPPGSSGLRRLGRDPGTVSLVRNKGAIIWKP